MIRLLDLIEDAIVRWKVSLLNFGYFVPMASVCVSSLSKMHNIISRDIIPENKSNQNLRTMEDDDDPLGYFLTRQNNK